MEGYVIPIGIILFVAGIIGFFIKRIIHDVDELKKGSASKNELEKVQAECKDQLTGVSSALDDVKKEYINKSDFVDMKTEYREYLTKLSSDIEGIKEDYITKEDFFRVQAETDRKLDRILDLLLERKGG